MARKGDIVVIEPRRLAARTAARRVASERGEAVGQSVGYEIRADRRVSGATRIRFVTEGVLTRQILADRELSRTDIAVIDEFHERHLAGDLGLALLRQLQLTSRPDLRIAVMSATLDPQPVQRFLGGCPIIQSAGRQFPVDIEYDPPQRDRPLDKQVARAVRHVLRDSRQGDRNHSGHILVFLPGASEIRRAMTACAELTRRGQVQLVPLHGDLPAAEQDLAVAPTDQRKVIFSTNVAETSITIEGVATVIDSGLARVLRHSPWSGIPALRVEPISQASADQRAGRAGRTLPGRCIRLYSRHDYQTRRRHDDAEVSRSDVAEVGLFLHAIGVHRLDDFAWFEPPPAPSIAAAADLLARLGAIDEGGAITEIGRSMLRFPVHPRQARMLVEAEERGVASDGCMLAALVGHRELDRTRRTSLGTKASARPSLAEVSGPSDLLRDLDRLSGNSKDHARRAGLDIATVQAVERDRKRLVRLCDTGTTPPPATLDDRERALLIATLTGYPDRVGRRRKPGSAEIILAGGGSASLSPASVVAEDEFLVAIEIEQAGRGAAGRSAWVRRASAVDPEWLFDLYIDRIHDSDDLVWNSEHRRVEQVSRITYDGLILDETRDPGAARRDPDSAADLLADAALAAGVDRFVDRAELENWRSRLAFAATLPGGQSLAGPTDDELRACVRHACTGLISFAELERIPIMDTIRGRLSPELRLFVDDMAPRFVTIPGRRRVPVHYQSDRPPWIASRLQDFFGLAEGPAVAGGAVALVLHLQAPNRRAVQVTSDLAGFWSRHYPGIRRQLMRRYPRHAWPEDPLTARLR